MKREGRQHGWVRTRAILPPNCDYSTPKSRYVNALDAPPAAGVFARAPAKPTNHSKFTGRCSKPGCAGCRRCPVRKSSAKAKGSAKLRRTEEMNRGPVGRGGTASAAEVVGLLVGGDEEGDADDTGDEGGGGGGGVDDDDDDGGWILVDHLLSCSAH